MVRIVIGALLLTFGLQWLRQGIRRVAAQGFWGGGEEEQAPEESSDRRFDWTAFALSSKGVLLEGLEIAFIVVTFGTAGILARGQLEKLPGRTLKFGVGGLLTTFGTFWSLEGLGVHWPGGDLSLAWLYPAYLAGSLGCMALARDGRLIAAAPQTGS